MAEELNCDLDEGSHHDGSDGGSKSSAEDAQEHANDSKQTFQPPPEKVEDVLDLDYDEGSPNGNQERAEDGEESSDGEIKDSSDENKSNAANGDKEEGEIDDSDEDDGEIEVDVERTRKVPIEARLSRPSAPVRDRCVKVRECPYEINGSCTWGPDCKYIHRNKEPLRLFSRGKVAEETSWERGLREAREAMRRASKKRQEPEFETKRLNAAPTGERTRTVHDSDSDDVSSPHRRSPHSSRQHIPSLLEIATLPPRFPSRSSSHKDLGPQVRYPCGRPPPPARGDRRSGGDGNSQRHSSSRQEKVKESAPRSRRESPHSSSSTKARSRTGRISPSLDASPISSDSSLSPARSPRKTANPTHTDKNVDKKVKKKVQSGSAMGDVTDPWARKKKATSWTKNNNEPKTRGRSSSNSTSSSSNSHEKLRRAAAANLNRNSRLPCSPPVAKVERRLSPPRGDIAGFRIPKKHRAVSSRDRTYSSGRGNCDSGRDVAFSKKSNVESHSSKRSESKKNREPCKLSDDEMEQTIDSRGAENISDSESAQSVSRSSSVMSSSSSQGSSQSRSASPALPAKYRVPGGKEDAAPASVEKTVASVSDSEGESKKKNRSKGASKGKRAGASPHLREISPSPSPPPPPPPPDDANSRRRQRDKSETPPPPPPPLPLINEFVLERQARKGKSIAEKRSSTEKSKRERSPPKKKAKGNHDGLTDKERRKRELMEQLRAVEEELKKRTAATSAL